MTILDMSLTAPLLTATQEQELARWIEAGLYAEYLLQQDLVRDKDKDVLQEVCLRGREARQQLWASNLRLVVKIALEFAKRHNLPVDDLFQEGCLGLATAIQRFDYRLGFRFTTLAHEYVQRTVAASAASRCGTHEGPLHRHRVRQRIRKLAPGETSVRKMAEIAGVTVEAVVTSQITRVSIDHLPTVATAPNQELAAVESVGLDFLELLTPPQARFLKLRYGLCGQPRSRKEVARNMKLSRAAAKRLEDEALTAARRLLQQDYCQLPAGQPAA